MQKTQGHLTERLLMLQLGGTLQPTQRLSRVEKGRPLLATDKRHAELRFGLATFCGTTEPGSRQYLIFGYTSSLGIEAGQIELGLGMTLLGGP